MGTISEKLSYLLETKKQLRAAIEAKGVAVPADHPFRDYARCVGAIPTGRGVHTAAAAWSIPARTVTVRKAVPGVAATAALKD